jgi:hypothetical protein
MEPFLEYGDFSDKVVEVSKKIKAKIWDMTEGKTDLQLKEEGIYNNDLEDFFRLLS